MTPALVRPSLSAALLLALALCPRDASAASWGSFDATRMAYGTGTLDGDAHVQLRTLIFENGDQLAPPTGTLTAEYLATVDVFYTGMLSDGTGPSSGAPGTLSIDEQNALQDFIAGGGTLIISPDSNGFEGPFALVYDSWLQDYGLTDFSFQFDPGQGQPLVAHRITDGVDAILIDGTVSFTNMAQAQVLATIGDNNPLLVVLEPATGFADGGRILVHADHNSITDNYIADADNTTFARNVVEWAAGDCGNGIVESNEECDDGNDDDSDSCDSMCMGEQAGGEEDGTTGGEEDGTTGDAEDGTDTQSEGSEGSEGSEDGETTAQAAEGDDASDAGCSCRSSAPSPAGALAPLLLLLGVRLRRRSERAGQQPRL